MRNIVAFKDYLSITKPGIVLGNLVSVAGGFFLASRGRIDWLLLLATGLGIALVVGSGCVFNNCIDRDIDCKMRRTRNRALVRGRVSLGSALAIGLGLGLVGSLLLYALTNLLTVAVVLSGFGIYVGVYSLYMKRHSRYGTLVGSLAGAVPPLAGYCAVTNHFDLGAVMLLLMFSLWQLPHAYAIAILHLQDYKAAEIPVLPVAKGVPFAKKHMAGYVAAFILASLLPTLGRYTGLGYLAVALALGGYWLYVAWDGRNAVDDRLWARKLFLFSIVMIMALSLMMSVDFKLYPGLQSFPRI